MTSNGLKKGGADPDQDVEIASPETDKLHKLKDEVGEVLDIAKDNVEKLKDRGENLELLGQRADELNETAVSFQKSSKKVHKKMRWKNLKFKLILAAILAVIGLVLLLVVLYATGAFSGKNSAPQPTKIVVMVHNRTVTASSQV